MTQGATKVNVVMLQYAYGSQESQSTLQRNFLQSRFTFLAHPVYQSWYTDFHYMKECDVSKGHGPITVRIR